MERDHRAGIRAVAATTTQRLLASLQARAHVGTIPRDVPFFAQRRWGGHCFHSSLWCDGLQIALSFPRIQAFARATARFR